jgi:putative addiction module CopG family antidote
MAITLGPEVSRLVNEALVSAPYRSADELVRAGLEALRAQEAEFAPGELEALIAAGEKSVNENGALPAEQVYSDLERFKAAARERTR